MKRPCPIAGCKADDIGEHAVMCRVHMKMVPAEELQELISCARLVRKATTGTVMRAAVVNLRLRRKRVIDVVNGIVTAKVPA